MNTSNFYIITFFTGMLLISTIGISDNENINSSYNGFFLTPDLAVSDLVIPDFGITNKLVTGSFMINNTGPVSANNVLINFYLNGTGELEGNIIRVGSYTLDQIPDRYRQVLPFSFIVPDGTPEGDYYMEVSVREKETDFSDTDNVVGSKGPIHINRSSLWKTGMPDLNIVISKIGSDNTSAGYPLLINYTISNPTNKSAGTYDTSFYLSSDNHLSPDDYRLRDEISYSLHEKENLECSSLDLLPKDIPAGKYYLFAVTDSSGMIQETDETNNIFMYTQPLVITSDDYLYSDEYSNLIAGYIFLKTNKYRDYLGLSPLEYDPQLSTIAYDHTLDMIEKNYFSHYSPHGIDPTGRAQLTGYDTIKRLDDGTIRSGISENIVSIGSGHTTGKGYSGFVDPTNPEEVADIIMTEWIESPDHNKNLINPTIDKLGVGVRFTGEYFFATQDFF